MDPLAYRRTFLARILRIAGAGGVAAITAAACSARSQLGVDATSTGSGGAAGATASGTGGHGGAPSSSSGTGGSTFVGASSSSSAGVTVGVGGSAPDGGLIEGTACLDLGGDPCPDAGAAIGVLSMNTGPCQQITQVLSGPVVNGTLCCYEVIAQPFPCYVGRTFFVDEGVVKADLRRGGAWRAGKAPAVAGLDRATRRALAEAWARDGLFEHASVASFSRFSMQLLALGAPADLVRDTHAAAMDEVAHAEMCLALASGYYGAPVEPAALPILAPVTIEPDLPAIAAEVAMEGCIGETVATVQALDALAAATDPAVRAVLERTVEDEARHAELGFRFLAWALDQGGEPVREAILKAFLGFRPPDPRPEDLDALDLGQYAAHGRQTAVEGRAIAERAMRDLVRPGMCALLTLRGRRDTLAA